MRTATATYQRAGLGAERRPRAALARGGARRGCLGALAAVAIIAGVPSLGIALPVPQLLKDINTTVGQDSAPRGFVASGGIVYFWASTDAGYELWRSDGTLEGTALLKDINPGPGSGATNLSENLVDVGGTLFFRADDGVNGYELWKSDGTSAGTVLVKDVLPGAGSSDPGNLIAVGDTLFFTASDGVSGYELWKSDGTAAGTVLVKDIRPGPDGSLLNPSGLVAVDGVLYFTADDGASGFELWSSDGTAAGTVLVKDIWPGAAGAMIPESGGLVVFDGALYFAANEGVSGYELWTSDGTAAGTVLVKDVRPGASSSFPFRFASAAGALYFSADDGVNGSELWKSDGTATGTVLVKDISPGAASTEILGPVAVGSTLFFGADDGANGLELWKSDGTAAGTVLVKDIRPGPDGSLAVYFSRLSLAVVGTTLFFGADDGVNGGALWKSDGTATGTVLVKDIVVDVLLTFFGFATLGDTLYFSGYDSTHGIELWASDGTAAGTVLVKDCHPASYGSGPMGFVHAGSSVFFSASGGLWTTDGSTAGTVLVKYVSPQGPIVAVGGTLFFTASDSASGVELWTSDGTAAGTVLVKDIWPGASWSSPSNLVAAGGTLFFTADDGANGRELWASDGTAAGTALVKDIRPGATGSDPSALVAFGGLLFFTANDGVNGVELWRSDGTAAGTVLVKDIWPGATGSIPFFSTQLVAVGGALFFYASDGVNGNELWKSDGTAAGTVLVKDIVPGPGSSLSCCSTQLTAVGGALFFTADDGVNGRELWTSDGTAAGTVLVKDILSGATSSSPAQFTAAGSALFFTADDGVNGRELWTSDGTAAGTMLVKDIRPGEVSSAPQSFVAAGGRLFFAAGDEVTGQELWTSDGTATGTVLVKDIRPGAPSSNPSFLFAAGGTLYFSADDGVTGQEPWVLLAGCGDGLLDMGEVCDDDNLVDGDGCDSNCRPTGCGNGIVTAGEQCDDGNTDAGDCCSPACALDSAGASCGADDFACTADVCDGAGSCTHPVATAGTSCRPLLGECDADDVCDGVSLFCPTNIAQPAGTPCTDDGLPCSLDECNGAGACQHPLAAAGAICRPSAGACDVVETCDGASPACPADAFELAATPCRPAAGACDVAETCSGISPACPADAHAPDGTSCDDGSVCTQSDACQGGACAGADPLDCDDGYACTADTCDPVAGCENDVAPQPSCLTAQKSILLLKQKDAGPKDKLLWKWIKGESVEQSALGDPMDTASYTLCVYAGATDALIADATVPPGPGWGALSDKGYKYKQPAATAGGITHVLVKGSGNDKSKALIKGKGPNLPDPALGGVPLPVTAQLVNGDTGTCLESVFDAPDVIKNDAAQFKAKAQ